MDDLLTTQQIQEILQVNRITIYRMLKDGRLTGIKFGHQWRFSRQEVEQLISGRKSEVTRIPEPSTNSTAEVLPLYCVQTIQDVFAEIAQVGAVTTKLDGSPLTEISNCSPFCKLILSSEKGLQACIQSWSQLAKIPESERHFFTCHAGLQYAGARIDVKGELVAMLIAGQFYVTPPESELEKVRIEELAHRYKISPQPLVEESHNLPVVSEDTRKQMDQWLNKVAHTFEHLGCERAEMLGRLQTIAAMSKF